MHSVRISTPRHGKGMLYTLLILTGIVVIGCYIASYFYEPLSSPGNISSTNIVNSCTRQLAQDEYRLKKDDWRYLFLMPAHSCYMVCASDPYVALNDQNLSQRRDSGCQAWNNPGQSEGYIALRGMKECTIVRITQGTCP